jgi:hypothetical protein
VEGQTERRETGNMGDYRNLSLASRVGNFRQKNYSAEDGTNGTDGTIGFFRQNSVCSAAQKTLGILFQTVLQRKKMLGILYHGTKIEANSRNSILKHSAEENNSEFHSVEHKSKQTLGILFQTIPQKRKQLGVPFCGTKIEVNSRNSFPKLSWTKTLCLLEEDFL